MEFKRFNGTDWEWVTEVSLANVVGDLYITSKCTVQLLNGLTDEVEFEETGNVMILDSLQTLFKRQIMELITYATALTGVNKATNPTTNNFLKYVILTTGSHDLSHNEYYFFEGNISGYADKTSTTSTIADKGLINLTESFITDKQAHWVFDFATDKMPPEIVANGPASYGTNETTIHYAYHGLITGDLITNITRGETRIVTKIDEHILSCEAIVGQTEGDTLDLKNAKVVNSAYMGYQLEDTYAFGFDTVYLKRTRRAYTNIGYGGFENAVNYFWGTNGTTTIYKIDPVTFEEVESYTTAYNAYGITAYNGFVYYMPSESMVIRYQLNSADEKIYNLTTPSDKNHICNDGSRLFTHRFGTSQLRPIPLAYFDATDPPPIVPMNFTGLSVPYGMFIKQGTLYYVMLSGLVMQLDTFNGGYGALQKSFYMPATNSIKPIVGAYNRIITLHNNAFQEILTSKGNLNLGARYLLKNPVTKLISQKLRIIYDFFIN